MQQDQLQALGSSGYGTDQGAVARVGHAPMINQREDTCFRYGAPTFAGGLTARVSRRLQPGSRIGGMVEHLLREGENAGVLQLSRQGAERLAKLPSITARQRS